MSDPSERWVSVREVEARLGVPKRTLYGLIERNAVRTKKIDGAAHVLEADAESIASARAAVPIAKQSSGNLARAIANTDDATVLEGRRRLEQKRLEAAELAAEAEVRRNRDALTLADAEREARMEEARFAAAKKRLELEHLQWQQQTERDAAEATERRRAREHEEKLRGAEQARDREQEIEAWRSDWLDWASNWAENHIGIHHSGAARRFSLSLLATWSTTSVAAQVSNDLRIGLEAHFQAKLKERRERGWCASRETLITELTNASGYATYGRRAIEDAARAAIANLDPGASETIRKAQEAISEAGFAALLTCVEKFNGLSG
jgi:hypothetical protein